MRISEKTNAKISSAFKNVGVSVEPLTAEEYKYLERIVKNAEGVEPLKFDETTNVLFAKLPDNLKNLVRHINEKKPSEEPRYAIPIILPDDVWTSFITDADEKDDLIDVAGSTAAIVGMLKTTEKDGSTYLNIRRYRGCLVINE